MWRTLPQVEHQLSGYTLATFRRFSDALIAEWLPGAQQEHSVAWLSSLFDLDFTLCNVGQIEDSAREIFRIIKLLKDHLKQFNDEANETEVHRIASSLDRVTDVWHIGRQALIYQKLLDLNMQVTAEHHYPIPIPGKYTPSLMEQQDEGSPFQQLVLYVLGELQKHGYRRVGEMCWEEIRTPDGYLSHAWREKVSIAEFVQTVCNKDTAWAYWKLMTASKDNLDQICRYLQRCTDVEFPPIKFNRHIFSFRNGLYVAPQDQFWPFDQQEAWRAIENAPQPELRDDAEREFAANSVFEPLKAPSRLDVAVQYFDTDFVMADTDLREFDVRDMPTPEFDLIMDTQELDYETKLWVMALLGRCLYDVGAKDNWQVLLFIKGIAGSGKSTVARIIRALYPATMVGVLSSNVEEKFGLSSLYDKLLFICTEVKHDFGLHWGDFQSVISGEEVAVPIKHATAKAVEWKTPGLLMGNEMFKATDAAGSIRRRIALVEFNFAVGSEKTDPHLFEHMMRNIGYFLRKINLCYLYKATKEGRKDIWARGVLPALMHDFANNMTRDVDALERYIQDRKLEDINLELMRDNDIREQDPHHPEYLMPYREFKKNYATYRQQNGYPRLQEGDDHYKLVFQRNGIVIDRNKTYDYNGKYQYNDWLLGIRYRPDHDMQGIL